MTSCYDGYGKAERRMKGLEKETGLMIQDASTTKGFLELRKKWGKSAHNKPQISLSRP